MSNKDQLMRRLRKLPLAVRAKVAKEALLQATALAIQMKQRAGKKTGKLRDSIRIGPGKYGDRFYVKAGGKATTKPVRQSAKGNAPAYDYANAQEFGNAHQKPKPFFYPTYRARKKGIAQALETVTRQAAGQEFDKP